MARYDKDFLGNEINIGDPVIFEAPKYRDFVVGTVISKAEKTCQIEYINTWNYPSDGKKMVFRQYYCQLIKRNDAALKAEVVRRIVGEILSRHTPDVDGFFMIHRDELMELTKRYMEKENE